MSLDAALPVTPLLHTESAVRRSLGKNRRPKGSRRRALVASGLSRLSSLPPTIRDGLRPLRPTADSAAAPRVGRSCDRRRRAAGRERRPHRADVGSSWRTGPAVDAGWPVDRSGPARRAPGRLPGADPAGADGPQPVAGRGVRHGSAGLGPPLAGVRDGLADRRPRRADRRRLRDGRRPGRDRGGGHAADHVSVRAVGDRRLRAVPAGRRDVTARRASTADLRDLVLPPPVRAALELPSGGRSSQISRFVEPILRSEALQAQSANIDGVSGATYTSTAYAQSLQSALDSAGI